MNDINSFKLMEEEDERLFPPPPDIEENLMGSLQVLAIMGEAMELYIPKVFEMFILTLGGTIKEIEKSGPNDLAQGGALEDPDDDVPGGVGASDLY